MVMRMITSMEANGMWGYARLGFFSHDSFKIQKGLLWNQRDNKYIGYVDFDDENAELEAFGEQCLHDIQSSEHNTNATIEKDHERALATQVHQIVWHSISHPFNFPIAYFGVETMNIHTLNTLLFHLAAKLECVAIHTCGSICDGAAENRRHIKSFDWFAITWKIGDNVEVQLSNKPGKKSHQPAVIVSYNSDRTEFLVQLTNMDMHKVVHSALRSPMPAKNIWNINDQCEVRNTINNEWYRGRVLTEISTDGYLDVVVSGQPTTWKSLSCDIRPVYDEDQHWMHHLAINPITGKTWFFLSDSTHVFKKLRNNVCKSHTSNGETRNLKKQWAEIPELKDISQGTQLFIYYANMYRSITHSRVCISSLDDPRLNALKEIKQWFIQGNKQKENPRQWFSAQCQFDLLLSINGFLGIVEYVLVNWPGVAVQPRRISQDMLEGLFGTIREMSGDSSTQTVQSYGYAINKSIIMMQMTSEIHSLNYGSADGSGCMLTDLKLRNCRTVTHCDTQSQKISSHHETQINTFSTFSRRIFQELLDDNLVMGKIQLPPSNHENVKIENATINHLQHERTQLIEHLL
ncbi:4743_t:CDS:2, partial [Paraglomus occultum]